jgi:hypothetical protein
MTGALVNSATLPFQKKTQYFSNFNFVHILFFFLLFNLLVLFQEEGTVLKPKVKVIKIKALSGFFYLKSLQVDTLVFCFCLPMYGITWCMSFV